MRKVRKVRNSQNSQNSHGKNKTMLSPAANMRPKGKMHEHTGLKTRARDEERHANRPQTRKPTFDTKVSARMLKISVLI